MFQNFTGQAAYETPRDNSHYNAYSQQPLNSLPSRQALPYVEAQLEAQRPGDNHYSYTGYMGNDNYDYNDNDNDGGNIQNARVMQVPSGYPPYPIEEPSFSNSPVITTLNQPPMEGRVLPSSQQQPRAEVSPHLSDSNNNNNNNNGDYDQSGYLRGTENLAEFSPIALKFQEIHRQVIQDGQNFTPSLQLKWCQLLFLVSQDISFVSRYSINAERLQRVLNEDEIKQNRGIILGHAFKVMEKLLRYDYPAAYYLMGCLYSHHVPGLNMTNFGFINKNDAKALDFYCKGAKLGHSDSAYRAGICFEFGKGTSERQLTKKRCLEKALQYYELGAVKCENTDCMFKLGIFYLNEVVEGVCDVKAGIEWLLKAVELGESNQACYELGKLHEFDGLSKETQRKLVDVFGASFRDYKRALRYYYKCAMDFNYSLAQWRLGHAYEFGELGLPVMASKSIAWYLKSAAATAADDTRDTDDTSIIMETVVNMDIDSGDEYEDEDDGEASFEDEYDPVTGGKIKKKKKRRRKKEKESVSGTSRRRKQKRNPNPMAMLALAGWFFTGAPNVLTPNYAESFYWVERSCQVSDGKLARSEYVLGYYYSHGIGCEVNMDQALVHYEKAAKLGHRKALEALNNLSYRAI